MNYKIRRVISTMLIMACVITMLSVKPALAATKPSFVKKSQEILLGKTTTFTIKNKLAGAIYQWKSSDNKIATVNNIGRVKGVGEGVATITCKIKTMLKTYTLTGKVKVVVPVDNSLPGISVKNGVYTFDSHVIGFTVKIGSKSYEVTKERVLQIASEWEDYEKSYKVNQDITLKRTWTPFVYDVYLFGKKTYTMTVDIGKQSVAVKGKKKFIIEDVVREYQFADNVKGIQVKVGKKLYTVTEEKVIDIALQWKSWQLSYKVPNTDITLYRTPRVHVYRVKMDCYKTFVIAVDPSSRKVTFYGGPNFKICKYIYETTVKKK